MSGISRRTLRKWAVSAGAGPFLILLALAAGLGAIDPRILSGPNLMSVAIIAAPVTLAALGTAVALIAGGIDLSLGMAVTFACIITATVLTHTGSLGLALGAGLAVMIAIGFVNGFLVGIFRIPPFVSTLSTMIALQGLTLYYAQGGVLIINDRILKTLGQGEMLHVPLLVVYAAAIAVLCALVLRHTTFGLRVYAVGSDSSALRFSGVNVSRQLVLTYVFASCFGLFCAVALIGRVPIVTPTMGGSALLLDGLSAAVLGGVSMFGGRGTVMGVIWGAITVSLITAATQIFGLDPSAIGLVKGGIVLAALVVDQALSWVSRAYATAPGAAR